MSSHWFVRLKDEIIEIILTIKQMICNPLMMILQCLWLIITGQEKSFIQSCKKLAEQDLVNNGDVMPNEHVQGMAIAVSLI